MFGLMGSWFPFKIWSPFVWNTICATKERTLAKLVLNRETIIEYEDPTEHDLKDSVFLNQVSNPFYGAVSDVQVWSRARPEKELAEWARCEPGEAGDLLDWGRAELNITGLTSLSVGRAEICRDAQDQQPLHIKSFNTRLSFYDSLMFCKRFGTIATAAATLRGPKVDKMLEAFLEVESPVCEPWGFYSGTVYSSVLHTWVDFLTGDPVEVSDWYPGRPGNNSNTENCIYFLTTEKKPYDLNCGYSEVCPICQLNKEFQLRGVCRDSPVDVQFYYRYRLGG